MGFKDLPEDILDQMDRDLFSAMALIKENGYEELHKAVRPYLEDVDTLVEWFSAAAFSLAAMVHVFQEELGLRGSIMASASMQEDKAVAGAKKILLGIAEAKGWKP